MTMPPRSAVPVSRRWKFLAVLIACATAAVGLTAHQAAAAAPRTPALTSRSAEGLLQPRTERAKRPQDRYAPAGGCYVVRSASSGGYLVRDGETVTATAGKAAHGTPFHFQATDLGRYLLFTRQADFLAVSDSVLGELTGAAAESSPGAIADGLSRGATQALLREVATGALGTAAGRGSTVGIAANPGELADWEVRHDRRGFRIALPALDAVLTADSAGRLGLVAAREADADAVFGFERVSGCARWPEVSVNVTGPVAKGATPYGEVRGYLDAHLHGMAFEFLGGRVHCGRPWHPYGVTHALRGCPEHEASGGRTHVMEAAVSGRDPVAGHDTTGWPTFRDWPAHHSLAYEQTYYRWIERAWRGGLRMYTNLLVDNNKLCDIYPLKRNSCNEMDGVRLQAKRLHEFERYIDAQNGGPGRGWFRIVTDPFEARRVMNSGKLAVIMGIEVSVLFDCGIKAGEPECSKEQVDQRLAEVHDLGVRQMELVNKFDNAFSGVAGDAGSTGLLVNGANFLQTGSFWQMGACDEHSDHAHDKQQYNLHDDAGTPEEATGRDALVGVVLGEVGKTGAAPVYGGGPHCNQLGLSDLGRHVIKRMAERGMIFDPDHMSAKARHDAMTYVRDELRYSGVTSSHSWSDDDIYRSVYRAGGVVTPMAGSSTQFVKEWRKHKEWADPRFTFGFGWGSDINGFAAQGGPRGANAPDPVTYPFKGFGGAVIGRQVSGERVYDINVDGVAHYGMYPDWVEDLRRLAGEEIVRDLERGPEAYLQMWERAAGVPGDSCRRDRPDLARRDLGRLRAGMTPEQVLMTLGQPSARTGTVFTYCGQRGRAVRVAFDQHGRLRGVE